jgi:hypothetical protein
MDELIGRLVAHIGVDWAAAEQAVGISCNVLAKAGPSDRVRQRQASLPEAEALMGNAASESSGGIGCVLGSAVVFDATTAH